MLQEKIYMKNQRNKKKEDLTNITYPMLTFQPNLGKFKCHFGFINKHSVRSLILKRQQK